MKVSLVNEKLRNRGTVFELNSVYSNHTNPVLLQHPPIIKRKKYKSNSKGRKKESIAYDCSIIKKEHKRRTHLNKSKHSLDMNYEESRLYPYLDNCTNGQSKWQQEKNLTPRLIHAARLRILKMNSSFYNNKSIRMSIPKVSSTRCYRPKQIKAKRNVQTSRDNHLEVLHSSAKDNLLKLISTQNRKKSLEVRELSPLIPHYQHNTSHASGRSSLNLTENLKFNPLSRSQTAFSTHMPSIKPRSIPNCLYLKLLGKKGKKFQVEKCNIKDLTPKTKSNLHKVNIDHYQPRDKFVEILDLDVSKIQAKTTENHSRPKYTKVSLNSNIFNIFQE